ncbi:MAG: KH domain-containing protein [Deltaproteobacteria bacterium]|nr:KH domain-containing protein [Deltaproteobacteria bacterium]
MKDLVRTIAEALVDEPEAVEVHEIEGDHSVLLELKVAKSDIGKVIGKEGRAAQSIRAIVSAAAQKAGRRAQLDILD